MIDGARKLPPHHITIRVPWHDNGWRGTVCNRPLDNTHCLALPRIGTGKRDLEELACAGKRLDLLAPEQRPPCIDERATFMSPHELVQKKAHPYASWLDLVKHFAETDLRMPAYAAMCVPFRWMLRKSAETIVDDLDLGWAPEQEKPFEDEMSTSWVQTRDNQLALLDTFFGAIEPEISLCFFYAKLTPLTEDPRRVIVGVGRVRSVGASTEYAYSTKAPPVRGMLWERAVGHSIREGNDDGFLFPYGKLIELAEKEPGIALEQYAAFAPEDLRAQYSYAAEHLPHDGAVASLLVCANALRKMREVLPDLGEGPLTWIDGELNRLWKARGAFPGLGSALCAFGLKHGNLVAYDVQAKLVSSGKEATLSPWKLVDDAFEDPTRLSPGVRDGIEETYRKKWRALTKAERTMLELLSRFEITIEQAKRWYKSADHAQILQNPYTIFERDRSAEDPIAFGTIDRGLFPPVALRKAFPLGPPSLIAEDIDSRRVRSAVIDTLEKAAAAEGCTLLPKEWVCTRVASLPLEPSCPLDDVALRVAEPDFGDIVFVAPLATGGSALQLDRYVTARSIIADTVEKRTKAKRHAAPEDWRKLVDHHLGPPKANAVDVGGEENARHEKAAALAEIFASRFSVLIGAAGTGKTTLLKALVSMPSVDGGGVLLLAPTGKARVRLEDRTDRRGDGRTVAQFLMERKRYDGSTGRYFVNPEAPKEDGYKTVIIDEASMLTEDQLVAVFDALRGVDRVVLVGDPRQLPPIGAGRPFVDIIRRLAPAEGAAIFPKVAPGYAELTVVRRQTGQDGGVLAAHFSGRDPDPGAEEVWSRVMSGKSPEVRVLRWETPAELQKVLVVEICRVLDLAGDEDEVGFALRHGAELYNNRPYFWERKGDNKGAGVTADRWQILSPVRGTLVGVDALNRMVQERFRKEARKQATEQGFYRKIPPPMGAQGILWGDKVINVQNKTDRRRYPKETPGYVANGDIGIVVGQFKTKNFKGLPKHLDVELASQPGTKFTYSNWEFGDDASSPLELAYALTVHKTQGSEFGRTLLVIPQPCRLLSRELLYTALTRHVDGLTLLVQGDPRGLRVFGSDARSEIARRMTNLFSPPEPCKVEHDKAVSFLEKGLVHRTARGEYVRSKSEVIIANILKVAGIDYSYERPLALNGTECFPDFTIADQDAGTTYYWEHLGRLDDPHYRARWEWKLTGYRAAGVLPWSDGGGPNGILVTTEEGTGIDATAWAALAKKIKSGG